MGQLFPPKCLQHSPRASLRSMSGEVFLDKRHRLSWTWIGLNCIVLMVILVDVFSFCLTKQCFAVSTTLLFRSQMFSSSPFLRQTILGFYQLAELERLLEHASAKVVCHYREGVLGLLQLVVELVAFLTTPLLRTDDVLNLFVLRKTKRALRFGLGVALKTMLQSIDMKRIKTCTKAANLG